MENKFFIPGSIIAVIILVFASLSPVVGYNSTKIFATASPLFSVRTKRAIQQEQNALTCEYIGKGKEVLIPLPTLNKTGIIQKFIDIMDGIDDNELKQVVKILIVNRFNNQNKVKTTDIDEIVNVLQRFKEGINKPPIDEKRLTVVCTADAHHWQLGCIAEFFFVLFLLILGRLLYTIVCTYPAC